MIRFWYALRGPSALILFMLVMMTSVQAEQDTADPPDKTRPTTQDDPDVPDDPDDSQTQTVEDKPVVITATRIETPPEHIGSSLTVIDAADLERRQHRFMADALQFAPGVDIRRTGGAGSQTAIFTRGTDSDHTLLLIDGIRLHARPFQRELPHQAPAPPGHRRGTGKATGAPHRRA